MKAGTPGTMAALADLRRELSANRRLQLGVGIIGAILVVYLSLVLRDWRAGLGEQYVERTQYLNKMKALAGQNVWIARAGAVARVRKALEAEIPAVATPGLAQAGAQGWLREAAVAFGQDVQVKPDAPVAVAEGSDLWRVPVTLSGKLEPQRYVQLLAQIERRPTLSVIEQSTVLNRNNRTFSLTVVSYYRITGGASDERP